MERFEREKVNKRTPPTVEQLAMVAESVVGKTGADWAREGLCMCVCVGGGGGEYMRNKLERIQGYTSTTKATRMTTRCTSNHYTPRFVSRSCLAKNAFCGNPVYLSWLWFSVLLCKEEEGNVKGKKKRQKNSTEKDTMCSWPLFKQKIPLNCQSANQPIMQPKDATYQATTQCANHQSPNLWLILNHKKWELP